MNGLKRILGVAAVTLLLALPTPAGAASFGIFGNDASGNSLTNLAAAITASGNTSTTLADLSAASLLGLDALWVLNGDNDAQPAQMSSNAAAIVAFVMLAACCRTTTGTWRTPAACCPAPLASRSFATSTTMRTSTSW